MRRLLVAAALTAALLGAASASAATPVEVNVSHERGTQAEVAVAIDPSQPNVLLAGSNSIDFTSVKTLGNLMRTYTSTDAGATWVAADGPLATPYGGKKRCNGGDPAPAIDAAGHQYLAFLATACITPSSPLGIAGKEFDLARLEVASRPDSASPWQVSQVYPVRSARFDDKPAITVDRGAASPHLGRVYVAWTRITAGGKHVPPKFLIAVSHSDDGGVTWSRPAIVPDSARDEDTFASLTVDSTGTLFVSWTTVTRKIFVDHSTDGGDTFGPDVLVGVAAGLPGLDTGCDHPGAFGVPAQSKRCITSDPTLQVDSRPGVPERVYVTFSTPDATGRAQDVVVRAYDPALTPLSDATRVHPADAKRDEFLPASAVDEAGRLWVCFYDTGADTSRQTARYTCTASADGGATWAVPQPVASVPSDENGAFANPFQYGDYEGLAVGGGVAHPVWTDGRDARTRGEEIYSATLTPADLQLP